MRWFYQRLGLTVIVLPVLLTASCGGRGVRLPETGATLEGTVTYGGEPLEFAMIIVRTQSESAIGGIGDDKHYRVENVPLGEVMIGVNTSAARGEYTSKMMAQGQGKAPVPIRFTDVPQKYFEPETSGIKTTITKGTNTYNIVIPK